MPQLGAQPASLAQRIDALRRDLSAAIHAVSVPASQSSQFAGALAATDGFAAATLLVDLKAKERLPAEDVGLERQLLLSLALEALDRVPALPVVAKVHQLFCDEFGFFAHPRPGDLARFRAGQPGFLAAWRLARLRRFPAGQLHWEISGLPRSRLLRLKPWDLTRVLHFVITQLGGFRPCIETHTNRGRRNPYVLIESEQRKSLYRLARSLEAQPEIRGVVDCSWLYSADTYRVSPHLAWLIKPVLESGGLVVPCGEAPADSGFLEGDADRARRYREGTYRPREGLVIWPRAAIRKWAAAHADLERAL